MTPLHAAVVDSPCGPLLLAAEADGRLAIVHFADGAELPDEIGGRPVVADDDGLTAAAAVQLGDYFAGRRRTFDLPLAPAGTPFQRRVWEALLGIPYGETRSYGAIAAALGDPGGSRAVGAANGANPLAIVVPCHRVVGADGSLVGYGGGLDRKRLLLALERGERRLEL